MMRPLLMLMFTCAILRTGDRVSPHVESNAQVPGSKPTTIGNTEDALSAVSRKMAEHMRRTHNEGGPESDVTRRLDDVAAARMAREALQKQEQAQTAAESQKQIEVDDEDQDEEYDEAKEKAEFEKQDKALNAAYAEMKNALAPELFGKLRDDQREWLKERAFRSALDQPERTDLSVASNLTKMRIEWIKAWAMMSVSKDWSGHYTDGCGGLLDVAEQNGRYYFRTVVARYYGSRGESTGGSVEGQVRVNGNTGWFETKVEDSDAPVWLTFLREMECTNSVRLTEENTIFITGRARFGGTYLWARELSAEERNEVIKPKK